MPSRLRNVCATLNNWTDENLAMIHTFAQEKCSYLVYGKEVGHATNTPHLQIYAEFHNKIAFSVVHRSLCKAHLEERYGTARQAAGYCKKGNEEHASGQDWAVYYLNPAPDWDGYEYGECSSQGKRVDIDKLRDSVMSGEKTVDEITVESPMAYHQFGRTLQRLEDIALRKKYRTEMTTCEWVHGRTGLGKSHYAYQDFDPENVYIWRNDKGWQDGYTGQETVVINDFRGGIPYNELLQLIDKWPYYLPRRNRPPAPFLAKHIIITSSLRPEEVYHNLHANDKLEQLMRRIVLKNAKDLFPESSMRKAAKFTPWSNMSGADLFD